MKGSLFFRAIGKLLMGLALLALLLFLPAWTLHYPQAWLFLGILFVPMILVGIVLFVKSPDLLEKRLDAKEEESEQRSVVALSGLTSLLLKRLTLQSLSCSTSADKT